MDTLRYDAVVFDVGGTLIGFEDPHPFREFLAAAGLAADEVDACGLRTRFLGVLARRRDEAQGLGASDAGLDAWWGAIFADVWPDRPDLAAEMHTWFRLDRFDRLHADALPALEGLRRLGLPLGVVSNFTADLENLLCHLGLRGYFDFVVVSAVVGLAKPDPRIFALAAANAGRPPHRLLYVGDHIGDDVDGAHGAGLDAVLIDRGDRFGGAACARLRSLEELPAYVGPPTWPARGMLFDFDGVIVDSFSAHLLAWQQTLEPLGIYLGAADLAPLEGLPTAVMAREYIETLGGRSPSPAEVQEVAEAKAEWFLRLLQPRLVPGAVPLLHNLHGRGVRLALVTGGAAHIVSHILSALGLDGLFDVVITAADTARGKPDPEPYAVAAARLGLAPDDCLAVENAPLGIRSAVGAGVPCLAVETTLPAARLEGATRTFADVRALGCHLLAPFGLSV